MPHYVDGFLLPVPKDKIDRYRQIAEVAGKIWREHGALEYRECAGDDLDIKDQVPFPRLVETKPEETVVFAWIVFESREHRDQVNAKVMADPRMASIGGEGRDAFRLQAHGLRRIQDHCRSLNANYRAEISSNLIERKTTP
jgi:uncharacterized protein YbaA (DUF1428 family)